MRLLLSIFLLNTVAMISDQSASSPAPVTTHTQDSASKSDATLESRLQSVFEKQPVRM